MRNTAAGDRPPYLRTSCQGASAYSGQVSAADTYRHRLVQYEALADAEARASRRYSRLRLLVAAAGLLSLVLLVERQSPMAAAGMGCALVVFVWLVVRHDRTEGRREAAVAMADLNREAVARLARDWAGLSPSWRPHVAGDHPYAHDIDLFGHASLVQVLGPVRTPTGRRTLSGWLLHPEVTDLPGIGERQVAVRELAPALDVRQQFAGLARQVPLRRPIDTSTSADMNAPDDELPSVVAWGQAGAVHAPPTLVSVLAVVLAILTSAGAVGALLGVVTGAWWLLAGALGWILRWWVHAPLEQTIAGASGEQGLRPWAPLIALVDGTRFEAGPLVRARTALHGRHQTATTALRRLEQLVALSDVRHSVWLYVPLQTLTLWDLHMWWLIDRWRRRHGPDVRQWLDAVGTFEALSSLASLAFDHPTWAFPSLDAAGREIHGTAVGHPLLADDVRVCNDVQLGPPGRFLLITGSNMSGKSTLLRAIGLGVVLAFAGAPVCAAAFRLPPLALHTSMRVSDSLELGLSLFMASLVRLQQIVDAARRAPATRRVCYLLDEVLQGTNSVERQLAVRTVMAHLMRCEAIGAVTTHDLDLAADPSFTAHADSAHLQETLHGSGEAVTMSFDYRLRPGPAQAGNAMQLLRMLGLAEAAGETAVPSRT